MGGFYFERYMDLAAASIETAGDMYDIATSDGELIRAIEDIGGQERADIARAIPHEASMIASLLQSKGVVRDSMIEFRPEIPVRWDQRFEVGWFSGSLRSATYLDAEATVHRAPADQAKVILSARGGLFAFMSDVNEGIGIKYGVALEHYSPVISTSMNDRAVLFGLAVLATRHDLQIPKL